ncbi:MAG TPA: amidohydrolase family protein, partial [Gammaproteobacteria bacterium]|nr:amidohydrolase family protein [Gammaproteobacteria bacterium]
MEADLLYHNGTILTDPAAGTETDTLAIGQGRVLAEGPTAHSHAAPSTRRFDFQGACVLPGFVDAHTHIPEYGLWLQFTNLGPAISRSEALEMVAGEHHRLDPDEWLVAHSWDESRWGGDPMPERGDLDRVCPGRPVLLMRADMHMGVASTAGLERLGLDPAGFPRGHLVEGPFVAAYESLDFPFERRLAAFREAMAACAREGVTSVHATLSPGDLRLLQEGLR